MDEGDGGGVFSEALRLGSFALLVKIFRARGWVMCELVDWSRGRRRVEGKGKRGTKM